MERYANDFDTTIAQDLDLSDPATITLADELPEALRAGDWRAKIGTAEESELVKITSVEIDNRTVTFDRAQENTTALAKLAGSRFTHVLTAESLAQMMIESDASDEVQTITWTGGLATQTTKFKVAAANESSAAVTMPTGGYANLTAAAVRTALITSAAFTTGGVPEAADIVVTGPTGGPHVVAFGGRYSGTDIGAISLSSQTGAVAATIVETTKGGQLATAASNVTVLDAGGYYASEEVEGALAELGGPKHWEDAFDLEGRGTGWDGWGQLSAARPRTITGFPLGDIHEYATIRDYQPYGADIWTEHDAGEHLGAYTFSINAVEEGLQGLVIDFSDIPDDVAFDGYWVHIGQWVTDSPATSEDTATLAEKLPEVLWVVTDSQTAPVAAAADLDGNNLPLIASPALSSYGYITGVAIDSQGRIITRTTSGPPRLRVYNPASGEVVSWSDGSDDGQFEHGNNARVAIDGNDNLFLCGPIGTKPLRMFSSDGTYEKAIGLRYVDTSADGDGVLYQIRGAACIGTSVWCVDQYLGKVSQFDIETGESISAFYDAENLPPNVVSVYDMGTDGTNLYIMAEVETNQVLIYSTDGTLIGYAGPFPDFSFLAVKHPRFPQNIDGYRDERVYICDGGAVECWGNFDLIGPDAGTGELLWSEANLAQTLPDSIAGLAIGPHDPTFIDREALVAVLPTSDQKDALDGAASPSATNVFATIDEIPTTPGEVGADAAGAADAVLATSVALPGDISPAQLTGNTDNWNPTGLADASVIRASTDASRNLTGLVGGVDGRIIVLHNVGGFDLVLKHDATSTAANRFLCANDIDVTLNKDATVVLTYDSTVSRWRVFSGGGDTSTLAPYNADYLVGTANGGLSGEIVVGTTPGGELGGTWASPTVDPTHSGSTHHAAASAGADGEHSLSGQVISGVDASTTQKGHQTAAVPLTLADALGDIFFADADNSIIKLAGQITVRKKVLTQTGTGSVSAAPAWGVLTHADVVGSALSRTGVIAQNMPRILVSATTIGAGFAVTQQPGLTTVELPAGFVVTSISFLSGTVAYVAGTGPNHKYFGLYDASLVLLASTGDDGSTAWPASTIKTLALTSPYTTLTAGLFYVGYLVDTGTGGTMPNLAGLSNTTASGLTPILSGKSASTGQTALPDPAGALTPGPIPYMEIL